MKNTHHSTPHASRPRSGPIAGSLLLGAAMLVLGACSGNGTTNARGQKVIRIPASVAQDQNQRFLQAATFANEAYETEDDEKAIQGYRRAVTTYTELPSAWNNLGVLQMRNEEYMLAADSFTMAANLSPSDPRPLYNHALLWDGRGYLREALNYYKRALDRDQNFLPALRGSIRAEALLNVGNEETLERIRRALMLETDERWIKWLRRQRVRVEALVNEFDSTRSE